MADISVLLPDGSARSVPAGATIADVAASIGSRLAKSALAGTVNGDEVDLTTVVADGVTVSVITADSDAGRHVLRHSTAHVLAQAVVQLFPGAQFSIGPAIEDGFYYDFELPGGRTFSDDDLSSIEARMREIMKANQPFIRSELSAADALTLFASQKYKCEIIERVTSGAADGSDAGEVGNSDTISVYRNSDEFVDLCRGPHESCWCVLARQRKRSHVAAHLRNRMGKRSCTERTPASS
jgi:threonyl-tRNA synthetase